MTTVETITMLQLQDLQRRADDAGNVALGNAARRAGRGFGCNGALRRCVAAINGTSAEGRRLAAQVMQVTR